MVVSMQYPYAHHCAESQEAAQGTCSYMSLLTYPWRIASMKTSARLCYCSSFRSFLYVSLWCTPFADRGLSHMFLPVLYQGSSSCLVSGICDYSLRMKFYALYHLLPAVKREYSVERRRGIHEGLSPRIPKTPYGVCGLKSAHLPRLVNNLLDSGAIAT